MNNLDKQYLELLDDILVNGTSKDDRTGTGTYSVFGRQIRHDMKTGFPLLTTKKMAWKTMTNELLWFLRGDTNIKWLVENGCNIWNGDAYKAYLNKNSVKHQWERGGDVAEMDVFLSIIKDSMDNEDFGDLGPVYGKQWRDWNGNDQIKNLIKGLKENPDGRRHMVSAWNVGELDQMVLPPCHYGFQMYTRELSIRERYDIWFRNNSESGMEYYFQADNLPNFEDSYYEPTPKRAISLMWNQRSVDTFLGLPFNIASYGLLLEIIAKEVNMVPDELIGNLGDVHLYSNHLEQAREQITRAPFELSRLVINDEFWNPDSSFLDQIEHIQSDDFYIENYQSHARIKAPLSN